MTQGALLVRWLKNDDVRNITRAGQNAPQGSSWRQLPLWPPVPVTTTWPVRSLRSYYLWLRVRSLLNFIPGYATEAEFVRWLGEKLRAAEYGALSLRWVKENAVKELRMTDEQLWHWLVKNCLSDGEFKSDGAVITLRS